MEDRDWVEGIMYSSTKSDADADIGIIDTNLSYNIWQKNNCWGDSSTKNQTGEIDLLLGYKYENFDYEISGVEDEFTGETVYVGETVLKYKVEYFMPYLGFRTGYSAELPETKKLIFLDTYGLDFELRFSPYLKAKDRDDHVLRNKLSTGETDGCGCMVGINSFLTTKNNWSFRLGLDFTHIGTDGFQDQYWYGNDGATPVGTRIEDIDLKITSDQYLWWGDVTYKF